MSLRLGQPWVHHAAAFALPSMLPLDRKVCTHDRPCGIVFVESVCHDLTDQTRAASHPDMSQLVSVH